MTVSAVGVGAVALWLAVAPAGPIYSVALARAAIARQPNAWVGRTIRLRAIAFPLAGTGCPQVQPMCAAVLLTDSASGLDDAATLRAYPGPTDALWQLVRRLPLGDRFVPAGPAIDWAVPAIYRVRFVSQPFAVCTAPCLAAQILGS